MTQRVVWCLSLLLATFVVAPSLVRGQCQPDASLWGGGVVSPTTGEVIVPAWCYDPGTGFLIMELSGLNGIADTTAVDPAILGDDVPFSAALIAATVAPTTILLDGNIAGFNVASQYFNGSLQFIGSPGTSPFLLPNAYDAAVFPTGLTPSAFGAVEMALNFGPGVPGGVALGSVQFVPEPAMGGLAAIALLAAGWFARRVR